MEIRKAVAIGGVLILMACSQSAGEFSLEKGRALPRFVAHLTRSAWSEMSKDAVGGFPGQMRNDLVHERVQATINNGMRGAPNGCIDSFLLDKLAHLPDGSVLLMGHCVNESELRDVHGDSLGLTGLKM